MAAIRRDLPALGKPTSPTSATTLSSSDDPGVARPRRAARSRAPCAELDASAALPSPPRPPGGDHQLGAGADQVGEHLAGLGVGDHRAVGDRQHEVVAVGAVGVVARAGLAVGGPAVRTRGGSRAAWSGRIDPQDHRAAVTAVAAVRAAERLELLPVDRGTAVAAVAAVRRAASPGRRNWESPSAGSPPPRAWNSRTLRKCDEGGPVRDHPPQMSYAATGRELTQPRPGPC